MKSTVFPRDMKWPKRERERPQDESPERRSERHPLVFSITHRFWWSIVIFFFSCFLQPFILCIPILSFFVFFQRFSFFFANLVWNESLPMRQYIFDDSLIADLVSRALCGRRVGPAMVLSSDYTEEWVLRIPCFRPHRIVMHFNLAHNNACASSFVANALTTLPLLSLFRLYPFPSIDISYYSVPISSPHTYPSSHSDHTKTPWWNFALP